MRIPESDAIKHLCGHRKIYLCHRNADPDAIGSAFALSWLFGGDIGVFGDLSRSAIQLADSIGIKPLIDPDLNSYELVVLVDTSVSSQIGGAKLQRYGVIDHHLDTDLLEDAEFYIQREVNSTAQIVWDIVKSSGRASEIPRGVALALVAGIVSDTGRFRHASAETFRCVYEILEAGDVDYGEVMEVLSRAPLEFSQRVAVLKAATRARITWRGEWIIACTEVSAFEGSSAMALLDLGADIAFAASSHCGVCRVSGRASFRAVQAGIDLAELMKSVARMHDGSGGGHRGAAAMEACYPPGRLLAELAEAALDRLKA
ncbi:MAG: DHH family phosphoesterase [Methanothrix sp.]|uniref:DHH family phosphoesterase n=1 Tax=Methanothrix sp. TaxID=90426 RepID=UPI0025E68570|nr:DHH family phosphoesterase [Methanothrix sp.]MCQ8903318.1 DHH family phosphoesterase [Methanothrix sp.]